MRLVLVLCSLSTALAGVLLSPSHAAAEACPAPQQAGESSDWLFVNGQNPSRESRFPFLRTRVRVGEEFTLDVPLGECEPGAWESGDAAVAIFDQEGRPALGRGVVFVGATGISTPAPQGTGLLWPQTRVEPGAWGHRIVSLRISSPGTYYVVSSSSQVSIGDRPDVWSEQPQHGPVERLDSRNPYAVGVVATGGGVACGAARWRDGALEMTRARKARRQPSRYRRAAAFDIRRQRMGCADVEAVLAKSLRERDELSALATLGYRVTRYDRRRIKDRRAYEIVAERDRERLVYRRFGSLRIDHSIYRAGQHIDIFNGFSPTNLSMQPCTGAFVLSIPGLAGQVGLTAAHCHTAGRVEPDRPAVNRGFAGDGGGDAPQLGVMLRPPNDYPNGLDATVFSILFKWGVAQQIERGNLPPLTVDGWVPTAQHIGKQVCIAGRSTGAESCGRVVKCPRLVRIRDSSSWCATYESTKGDSGGPVYLAPGRRLSTRAVGIVEGSWRGLDVRVYTPIEEIMVALNATLPSGPYVRGPIDSAPGGGF